MATVAGVLLEHRRAGSHPDPDFATLGLRNSGRSPAYRTCIGAPACSTVTAFSAQFS